MQGAAQSERSGRQRTQSAEGKARSPDRGSKKKRRGQTTHLATAGHRPRRKQQACRAPCDYPLRPQPGVHEHGRRGKHGVRGLDPTLSPNANAPPHAPRNASAPPTPPRGAHSQSALADAKDATPPSHPASQIPSAPRPDLASHAAQSTRNVRMQRIDTIRPRYAAHHAAPPTIPITGERRTRSTPPLPAPNSEPTEARCTGRGRREQGGTYDKKETMKERADAENKNAEGRSKASAGARSRRQKEERPHAENRYDPTSPCRPPRRAAHSPDHRRATHTLHPPAPRAKQRTHLSTVHRTGEARAGWGIRQAKWNGKW
ncbi:hypothetical protein DFH09DRAFT_1321397 [Mycena vulgaris]|nr:hypothetical protein DFH09DRAFT_1321397 [Mycena vulgaris]